MDDLDAKETKNFEKYDGAEFDMTLFDDILYVADEKEQVELLAEAGFDVKLIGYSVGDEEAPKEGDEGDEYDF